MRPRASVSTALSSALLLAGTLSCGSRAEPLREEAATPPPSFPPASHAGPPLLLLHQRDDRDLAAAASLRTSRGVVVLVSFRQPNRPDLAGVFLRLDAALNVAESLDLPARPFERGRPALAFLDDPHGPGAIVDLVPEPDPLGGNMVGLVHFLREARLETRRLPRLPTGLRWAGPALVSLDHGDLQITTVTAKGEAIHHPFASPPRTDPPALGRAAPAALLPGPALEHHTTCDVGGCRTVLHLSHP